MSELTPNVLVFCALLCEAKPLIQAWRLEKLSATEHPFRIYAGGGRAIVISGIGKVNMAGAVGYAMAVFGNPGLPVLINLGIAGHQHAALGALALADKITDQESGKCFYPQMPFAVPCPTYSLMTGVKPEINYADAGLYEMEAAGFYELAVKFGSSELIHVIKIVSDNRQSGLAEINEKRVEDWISNQLPVIDELIARLLALRQLYPTSAEVPFYRELVAQFHFSFSNTIKLKGLLQRWQLICGDQPLDWTEANIRNTKELMAWLEKRLDEAVFCL